MQIYTGTSGFSYKEWKGKFYPEKLPQKAFLSYYADCFDTVEINATFYRMPKESVLVDWSAQVGGRFQFVLKTSRRVTHRKAFDEDLATSCTTTWVRRKRFEVKTDNVRRLTVDMTTLPADPLGRAGLLWSGIDLVHCSSSQPRSV